MSAAVNSTRHLAINRTTSSNRRVIVPDRMIVRHNKGASPIINLQPSSKPAVATHKKQHAVRHQPIASSKVHKTTQKEHQKQAVRPVTRQVEASVEVAMSSMLERRNSLPKHLARTAGRAHLLSQVLQTETKKVRWHQRIFAGLTTS